MTPSAICNIALSYLEAGRSVLSIAPGSKKPSIVDRQTGEASHISWKTYQERLPSIGEVKTWFAGQPLMGIGIAAGPVSGITLEDGTKAALEFLDFDTPDSFAAFLARAKSRGYGDLIGTLTCEQTPSWGGHLAYLCIVWEGNQKLAQRQIGDDAQGRPILKTLIETRGKGGQCVVAPTPPGIHPDHPDRSYTLLHGSWTDIPVITPEARQALIECARSLNEYAEEAPISVPQESAYAEGGPVDDFNRRYSRDAMLNLLIRNGWVVVHHDNGTDFLKRPGKAGDSWSATLGHVAPNVLYVFSSNASPFEPDRAYKPYSVYALLEHRGDFHAATRHLVLDGYGTATSANGTAGATAPQDCHSTIDVDEPLETLPLPPISLDDLKAVFRKWLYLADEGIIEILSAAYVANLLPGDALWIGIIGPPSSGKTEPIMAFSVLPHMHVASTLSEAALLSGTPGRQQAKGAKGGLLREIGKFGFILCKDFTSVLAMQDKIRGPVLAALREIYDGHWTRLIGSDGGKQLTWNGKVAIIAGCTDAIDTHHAVMASMGQRFLFYRLPAVDAYQQGKKAIELNTQEASMRKEMKQAVSQLFAGRALDHLDLSLPPNIEDRLIRLAILAVEGRSPIERDTYTRDITLIPDPESPARFVKGIGKLWIGLMTIGVPTARAWELVLKVGLDSLPRLRRQLIENLAVCKNHMKTSTLAVSIGYPTQTTRRALEDLAGLKLIDRQKGGPGKEDTWLLTERAAQLYDEVTKPVNYGYFREQI